LCLYAFVVSNFDFLTYDDVDNHLRNREIFCDPFLADSYTRSSHLIADSQGHSGAKSYGINLYTQAQIICYSPILLAYILLLRNLGFLCHHTKAMPKDLSPVIQQLIRWRKNNDLSQSEAVRILEDAGLPVKLGTLQHWEIGRARPHPLSAAALAKFLERRPYLKNSPSPESKGATPKS
jgi:DNA-binding transcriptional regulator YiaG